MQRIIKAYLDKGATLKVRSKIIDWQWNLEDQCMDILIEELE